MCSSDLAIVLAHSPVLSDGELIDCATVGDAFAQGAIAVRAALSASVSAALAEVGAREALIALEVEGIIEVRTGSGIYVLAQHAAAKSLPAPDENTPTDWGPLEVMQARLLVEAEVAALAALHAKRQAAARGLGRPFVKQ